MTAPAAIMDAAPRPRRDRLDAARVRPGRADQPMQQPFTHILPKASFNSTQVRRRRCGSAVSRLVAQHRHHHIATSSPSKALCTRHLEQHATKRPDVGAAIDDAALGAGLM